MVSMIKAPALTVFEGMKVACGRLPRA